MNNSSSPAFPQSYETCKPHMVGMTLRDYFAAKALSHGYTQNDSDPYRAAEWAYKMADAMLEARK